MLTTPAHWTYLKIAEGCDNRCTYCAIPSIRGKFRSRPIEDIVAEAKTGDSGLTLTEMAPFGVVGAIISVVSITFVVISFVLSRNKDSKQEITEQNKEMNGISRSLLELDLKLTQVFNTTTETRNDIKAMNNQIAEHGKQIALLERDIADLKETKADK